MHDDLAGPVRNVYARIAGGVYLLLIVMFMSGEFIIGGIVGEGGFAAAAHGAASAERLYRVALALQTMAPVCTIVLAYALYVVVRPVNEGLAQMALLFRLGETFIGAVAIIFSFDQLRIYTSFNGAGAAGAEQWQALMTVARNSHFVGFHLSTLFFSVGSVLFFSLFLKGAYLPKVQSVFGIGASLLVACTSVASLVMPEYRETIQLGFAPIFVSEIVTGLWLLLRGVRLEQPMGGQAARTGAGPAALRTGAR